MALRMEVRAVQAFVLGAACAAIYQTFPVNLWYFWEILSTTTASVFVVSFLLLEDVRSKRDGPWPWLDVFVASACSV